MLEKRAVKLITVFVALRFLWCGCSTNEATQLITPPQKSKPAKSADEELETKESPIAVSISIPGKNEHDVLLSPKTLRENDCLAARISTPIIEATALTSLVENDQEKAIALFSQNPVSGERNFFIKAEITKLKKAEVSGGIMSMKTHSRKYKLMANVANRVVRLWEESDSRMWREGNTVILDCHAEADPAEFIKGKNLSIRCSSVYPETIERQGVPVTAEQLAASSSLSDAVLAQCQNDGNNRPCYQLKKGFAQNFFKSTWLNLSPAQRDKIVDAEKAMWR